MQSIFSVPKFPLISSQYSTQSEVFGLIWFSPGWSSLVWWVSHNHAFAHILALFILIDFPKHIDTISMV